MGEGKSEGGPGVDRGGGRGCQLGPGLSSGSLFLPRVSLGAAGDNVALRVAAGGGGTRRTERYPPGPTPSGTRGLGGQGGREERGFPRDGVGASSCCLPSLCHRKVPRRTGGAQLGGCPNASYGRWPVPITGAFGVPTSLAHLGESTPLPANPPRVVCGSQGTLVALSVPLSHRQPRLFSPGGIFCPWRIPAAIHPQVDWGPRPAARPCRHPTHLRMPREGVTAGCIPPPPPHFRLPCTGNSNIPSLQSPPFSSPR